MSIQSPYISESGIADFEQKVLAMSADCPVLVDFWADWCAPCKILMPVLGSLAEEYQGKFLLVKVNSDQSQALATQFGVRSLPTVKVFRHGEVVDEFMGALPESQVREFLDKHVEHESDRATTKAVQLLEQGQIQEAITLLRETMAAGAANDKPFMTLAEVLIQQGELEEAQALLKDAARETWDHPEYARLVSRLDFKLQSLGGPDRAELEQRISTDPGDLEARAQLGALLVSEDAFEDAMVQYLEIVRRDRAYADELGRTSLLGVFAMLGDADERVKKYRRQLAIALN